MFNKTELCLEPIADSEPFAADGAVSESARGQKGSYYHAAAIVPIAVPLFYKGRGWGWHTARQGQLLTDPVQER